MKGEVPEGTEVGPAEIKAPTDAGSTGASGAGKKERVLHTRIPAVLEQELKRFAESMRIPVSNLVRTILEDAVSVADTATSNVEAGLKNAAQHLQAEREKLRARVHFDPLKQVYAFQLVTLAQEASCTKCKKVLSPGMRAHLGLTDGQGATSPRIFVCDECLPRAEAR